MSGPNKITTVDEYIKNSPKEMQLGLKTLRRIIKESAPMAEEKIAWNMAAYYIGSPLVFFAAAKHHIGFYPTPSAIIKFKKELAGYKHSKGAVQFPLDKPIPLALIKKMVKFRVGENIHG